MKIPALFLVPRQEPLIESATESRKTGVQKLDTRNVKKVAGVELDSSFSAIPAGSGDAESATLESMDPETSQTYIVRGFIESDDLDQFTVPRDGARAFADPQIDTFLTCGGDPPVGDVALVKQRLDVARLAANGLDGSDVAIAILDTGVNLNHLTTTLGFTPKFDAGNSWAPSGVATLPGQFPVGHGTMCAFDSLIAAPKATLIDCPILASNAPGGSAMGRRLSVAIMGYAHLIAFWGIAFAPGGAARYKALVVNNSWGMYHPTWDFPAGHPGRYSDNPNHPFNIIVSTLLGSGADIVYAAGNCGQDCPAGRCQGVTQHSIRGANALADVLTMAGCDTNDDRVGYSSQGPAIPGMGPRKPDLTGYTHFLGSEAMGTGSPDSGTSTSCPVAAGCIAALRTRLSTTSYPPSSLFATLRTTARQVIGAGHNNDTGYGIIDPVAAGKSLGVIP